MEQLEKLSKLMLPWQGLIIAIVPLLVTAITGLRIGRIAGLEAAYVDGALNRAAQVATLRYEDVLRLVLGLVDRTRQPPDKAPPRPAADLAAIIGGGKRRQHRAQRGAIRCRYVEECAS